MKKVIVIEGADIEEKLNEAFEEGYRIVSQSSVGLRCKRSEGYRFDETAVIKTVILQLPDDKEDVDIEKVVQQASVIELNRGQVLIIYVPQTLAPANRKRIRKGFASLLPEGYPQVMFLEEGITLGSITTEEWQAQLKEFSEEKEKIKKEYETKLRCPHCEHVDDYQLGYKVYICLECKEPFEESDLTICVHPGCSTYAIIQHVNGSFYCLNCLMEQCGV